MIFTHFSMPFKAFEEAFEEALRPRLGALRHHLLGDGLRGHQVRTGVRDTRGLLQLAPRRRDARGGLRTVAAQVLALLLRPFQGSEGCEGSRDEAFLIRFDPFSSVFEVEKGPERGRKLGRRTRIVTLQPRSSSSQAALRPARPPPTITTFDIGTSLVDSSEQTAAALFRPPKALQRPSKGPLKGPETPYGTALFVGPEALLKGLKGVRKAAPAYCALSWFVKESSAVPEPLRSAERCVCGCFFKGMRRISSR